MDLRYGHEDNDRRKHNPSNATGSVAPTAAMLGN